MSRRKALSEVRGHRTKAEIARRAALESAEAQSRPADPAQAVPDPSSPSLAAFLDAVRQERASFDSRVRPDETLCLDAGAAYTWPEGDAATIARQYAQDIAEGKITAGELIRFAAKRFLADLENGHARGLYFDPSAARNAVGFARLFCGLDLMPWQTWVLAQIFGWKRATGFRRFQEAWLSIGRKNGKTTFASAVALFLLIADQERYPEIYAAATAKEQSRIVWRDARRAVGSNPELAAAVKRWASDLEVEPDCHFQPLASEERSFLGVRAHGIIADEVGVWQDRNAWDVLVQSTVSRKQPLSFGITTAPEDRRTFCFEKFQWVERILRGIIQADHVFAAVYTIDEGDSPTDMAALLKSNPSLGVTLFEEQLQKQIDELKETPSGLNNFLQFHANVTPERTLSQQSSISAESWASCAHRELLPDAKDSFDAVTKFLLLNRGIFCWLGLDYGATDDMCCVVYLFRHGYLQPHQHDERGKVVKWADEHEKRFVICDYFMPEEGLLEKERQWHVPLSTWVREKWITLTPGNMVDQREIKKHLIDTAHTLRPFDCGFDKWQTQSMMAEIHESKIMTCTEVPQKPSVLTDACRELLADIRRGEIVHFGNPVLAWNIDNVLMQEDGEHGGMRPVKVGSDKTRKIDGVQALVTAYCRMLAAPPTYAPRVFTI